MSRNPTEAHPQTPPMQLDQDEVRVLAECERESLMYRSIPLSVMIITATQYAMARNLISANGRWIKFGAGLFTGYLLGKVSYAPACRQKILTQIPHSNLAHAIRGVDARHTSDSSSDDQGFPSYTLQQRKDPNEAVVFVPDPADLDTHIAPIGVNQYGDPIYDTRK